MNATKQNGNTPSGVMNRILDHVAQQFLEYMGRQDERQTIGKVIYHFNILDPTHRWYRSAVTFVKRIHE